MSSHTIKYRLQSIRKRALAASALPASPSGPAYLNAVPSGPAIAASPASRADDDRRRFARVATRSDVTVRRLGGFNFQVAMSNVSAGGCNVELIEAGETGDSAIARFPQLEPLGSRICWTRGPTTGLEFATPIHPAVFDLLVSRLPVREARRRKESM